MTLRRARSVMGVLLAVSVLVSVFVAGQLPAASASGDDRARIIEQLKQVEAASRLAFADRAVFESTLVDGTDKETSRVGLIRGDSPTFWFADQGGNVTFLAEHREGRDVFALQVSDVRSSLVGTAARKAFRQSLTESGLSGGDLLVVDGYDAARWGLVTPGNLAAVLNGDDYRLYADLFSPLRTLEALISWAENAPGLGVTVTVEGDTVVYASDVEANQMTVTVRDGIAVHASYRFDSGILDEQSAVAYGDGVTSPQLPETAVPAASVYPVFASALKTSVNAEVRAAATAVARAATAAVVGKADRRKLSGKAVTRYVMSAVKDTAGGRFPYTTRRTPDGVVVSWVTGYGSFEYRFQWNVGKQRVTARPTR